MKPTDKDIATAREIGKRLDRVEPLAVAMRYIPKTNGFLIELKSGVSFTIPVRLLPLKFRRAEPAELRRISIDPPGTDIWFDKIDDGISVKKLHELAFGAAWIHAYASALTVCRRGRPKVR